MELKIEKETSLMWYWRVCKKYTIYKGKKYPFWCLIEYFPRIPKYRKAKLIGHQAVWSDQPEAPTGCSRKDLINGLEMMLKDARHYRTLVEKKPHRPLTPGK
jgi:hypothetical protein